MNLLIHNPEEFPGTESGLRTLVDWLANRESLPETMSIVFVAEEEMSRWNERHRGRDGATDVLSYRYEDEGEVLICPGVIDRFVERENRPRLTTYWEVLLHGLLHLSGYDHERDDGEHLNRQDTLLEEWFRDHPDRIGEMVSS